MGKNINSAHRVKEILTVARSKPNKSTADIWAEVFKIEETEQNKRNFEVSRCLNQLHDEIEIVRYQMEESGLSDYLFAPLLNKANGIVAVHNLPTGWDQFKGQITPELILCLGFCSEVLPNEEYGISENDIKEILDLVSTLEMTMENSSLPSFTRSIIRKHLEKIKLALHSYEIIGSKALNEVVQSAYGEVVDNVAVFDESKETSEIKTLAKLWQKIKTISEKASAVEKQVATVSKLGSHANNAIEYLQSILG